jgi:hypothetical protein
MPTQSKVVDTLLEDQMSYVYSLYQYLQVATGTTDILETATSLSNSTQIGISSALYNKLKDTATNGSFIDGRTAVYKFVLESGEPYNLPVNIGSVGLMKQATSSAGLGIGGAFPVTATKDNQSRWVLRCEVTQKRIGE